MAQRKVTIFDKAVEEVSYVAYFIEAEGFPLAAKNFVEKAFAFFVSLSDTRVKQRPCSYKFWK